LASRNPVLYPGVLAVGAVRRPPSWARGPHRGPVSVMKAVTRSPSESVNRSCAPGMGAVSLRRINRVPVGPAAHGPPETGGLSDPGAVTDGRRRNRSPDNQPSFVFRIFPPHSRTRASNGHSRRRTPPRPCGTRRRRCGWAPGGIAAHQNLFALQGSSGSGQYCRRQRFQRPTPRTVDVVGGGVRSRHCRVAASPANASSPPGDSSGRSRKTPAGGIDDPRSSSRVAARRPALLSEWSMVMGGIDIQVQPFPRAPVAAPARPRRRPKRGRAGRPGYRADGRRRPAHRPARHIVVTSTRRPPKTCFTIPRTSARHRRCQSAPAGGPAAARSGETPQPGA